MLNKVLIANRGEIAVRVIRTCRELDIPVVAVFSEADRTAPHVLLADEAVCVGPPPSSESYLRIDAILDAARSTGADALHPGYGFLSENAGFARAVAEVGLTWIGPPPEAIELMGDKLAARRLAGETGAPVVPGTTEPISDLDAARQVAAEVGYPVLLKAAGGGGGKGMRIVHRGDELAAAFERARSEAAGAFTDDRIYLEKVIPDPHHVEVQVLVDDHGNVVVLGERECSVQRRYQKIVEETPSPFITSRVREQLMTLAGRITAACGYRSAGTVEFLVDRDRNFYFLEMNTRLQVEHPITEMVTGVDLVAEQLRIASGEPLSLSPQDIQPRGCAIECRIYAEDGFEGFAPSTGEVLELVAPDGFGVRLDHGLRPGMEVTPYYDPLLGKLCTWGRDRPEALRRMARALEELRIVGLRTTIPFCMAVMHHPAFTKGSYHTGFITDHQEQLEAWARDQSSTLGQVAAIGAAMYATARKPPVGDSASSKSDGVHPSTSNWLRAGRERQMSPTQRNPGE